MKGVVIQNSPNTSIGLIGPILGEKHGFQLETIDAAEVDFGKLDPDSADLFVILGSPRGVYERHVRWIEAEFEFTKRLLERQRPTFGICFGGQMIAAALGATVEPMGDRHRGWLRNDVAVDDVWAGPWFRWHGDRFDLPEGARKLASAGTITQGFQFGNAVGVQFHPEVDDIIVRSWVEESSVDLVRDGVDLIQFIKDFEAPYRKVHPRLEALMEDVVRRCMS